jgi:hypothetical protein
MRFTEEKIKHDKRNVNGILRRIQRYISMKTEREKPEREEENAEGVWKREMGEEKERNAGTVWSV